MRTIKLEYPAFRELFTKVAKDPQNDQRTRLIVTTLGEVTDIQFVDKINMVYFKCVRSSNTITDEQWDWIKNNSLVIIS